MFKILRNYGEELKYKRNTIITNMGHKDNLRAVIYCKIPFLFIFKSFKLTSKFCVASDKTKRQAMHV